jgi:hypothetical protein
MQTWWNEKFRRVDDFQLEHVCEEHAKKRAWVINSFAPRHSSALALRTHNSKIMKNFSISETFQRTSVNRTPRIRKLESNILGSDGRAHSAIQGRQGAEGAR